MGLRDLPDAFVAVKITWDSARASPRDTGVPLRGRRVFATNGAPLVDYDRQAYPDMAREVRPRGGHLIFLISGPVSAASFSLSRQLDASGKTFNSRFLNLTTASPHLDKAMRRQDSTNFTAGKDAQSSQR